MSDIDEKLKEVLHDYKYTADLNRDKYTAGEPDNYNQILNTAVEQVKMWCRDAGYINIKDLDNRTTRRFVAGLIEADDEDHEFDEEIELAMKHLDQLAYVMTGQEFYDKLHKELSNQALANTVDVNNHAWRVNDVIEAARKAIGI